MKRDRWKLHLAVAAVAIAAMTMALTPAVADPVPDTDEYPDVAFLARNDVPFDAQTAASMAAQLGAPMFITRPDTLSGAAADGISDLNPEVLIVAGGVNAVSDAVANEAAEQCNPDCTIDRRFGIGRDETAADLAEIAADYGFDRPVLQGTNHVAGDVHVNGTVSTNALTVEDTGLVSGLNADRVDGMHAADFLGATEQAVDSDQLDGLDSTDFVHGTQYESFFEVIDGATDVTLATNGPVSVIARCDPGTSITILGTSTADGWYVTDGTEDGAAGGESEILSSTSTSDYEDAIDNGSIAGPNAADDMLHYIGVDGESMGFGLGVFGHDCVVAGSAFMSSTPS